MKTTGRAAYRNQALELISLSRFLIQKHEPSLESYARLRNALQLVDDALILAAKSRTNTSKKADERFTGAINVLSTFKNDFLSNDPVSDREWDEKVTRFTAMATHNTNDGSRGLVDALKENLSWIRTGNEPPEPTRVVEFILLKYLTEERPIIVRQILSERSNLQEILWNFRCLKKEKRLGLQENPHFYTHLPTSPEAYGGGFKIDPTEDFRRAERFYVLTDRSSLVYIKAEQYSRCFGNLWHLNGAIIFRDLSGRLLGENIIKASLKNTYWRFCTQPPTCTDQNQRDQGPGNRHTCLPVLSLECPCENWKRQIDGLTGSDIIKLRVCAGRVSPDSPLLTRTPLPPTSEQPQYSVAHRTHIHMLNYDSLLKVFHYYRLEDVDSWYLGSTWWKLSHVCQRWRNGFTSVNSLAHLPPLPFVINYCNTASTRVRQDEESIFTGLQQRGRVRRVLFQAPSQSLRVCLGVMGGLFPMLENLSLLSTTEDEASLVLPHAFQAPNLRHLSFEGIGLPTGLQLFTSTIALITLTLTRIPASCYFPPGQLVAQLQGLPRLEEISISFAVPIPLPSAAGELLPAPIPPVTLPILKRLIFRGVGAYLENLVVQIGAPCLQRLCITLHFELAYTLVNLTKLICVIEEFGCPSARVLFNRDGASIVTRIGESRDGRGVTLNVSCEPLDWKIDSAAQVCGALQQALSSVEDLTLDLDEDGMTSDPEHAPDRTLWHELLLTFGSVKKLHIGSALISELSDALNPGDTGLVPGLLPELQDLEVQLDIDRAYNVFSTFIEARKREGRRVRLLVPPVAQLPPQHMAPPTQSQSQPPPQQQSYSPPVVARAQGRNSRFKKAAFVKYMKNTGRAYRKQAMELISLCRTFVQAQAQTPDSDGKRRTALKAVDDALSSAADMEERETSNEVDMKFDKAIEALSHYEAEFHPRKADLGDGHAMTVHEKMTKARSKDKSGSAIMNVVKEKLSLKVAGDEQSEPTMVVEFLILKSLTDNTPTTVKQVLSEKSNLQEVLWNFTRFRDGRRLTLKENPHFYKSSDLPRSPEFYVGDFRADPIDNFMHKKIYVLTDKPFRIFLKTDQIARAFGNVWIPKEAIILKDVCGKLEGESVVQASFPGAPNTWYLENLPLSYTSSQAGSSNPRSPIPTTTASSSNSASDDSFVDWREPIRRSLASSSPPSDICIRALPLNKSSPGSPPSSSAMRSGGSNYRALSKSRITPQASAHRTHKPTPIISLQPSRLSESESKMSPIRQATLSPMTVPMPSPQQPPIAASPQTDVATPTSILATPNAPTSYDTGTSRRQELEDGGSTGEPPTSLQKPQVTDLVLATPLPTATYISPSETANPHIVHTEGGEDETCGNVPNQAEIRDNDQRKAAAKLDPCPESTLAPVLDGGAEGFRDKPSRYP